MNGDQSLILSELEIRFALTAVLTVISASVWKRNNNACAAVSEFSIWQSFTCAPCLVKAVVFWGLIEVVFSMWWQVSSELPILGVVAIVAVNLLKWMLLVWCMLNGHKWPRFYFLIVGCLSMAGGVFSRTMNSAHVWNNASVNMVFNGVLGVILYSFLARKSSESWRNAVLMARLAKGEWKFGNVPKQDNHIK